MKKQLILGLGILILGSVLLGCAASTSTDTTTTTATTTTATTSTTITTTTTTTTTTLGGTAAALAQLNNFWALALAGNTTEAATILSDSCPEKSSLIEDITGMLHITAVSEEVLGSTEAGRVATLEVTESMWSTAEMAPLGLLDLSSKSNQVPIVFSKEADDVWRIISYPNVPSATVLSAQDYSGLGLFVIIQAQDADGNSGYLNEAVTAEVVAGEPASFEVSQGDGEGNWLMGNTVAPAVGQHSITLAFQSTMEAPYRDYTTTHIYHIR